MPQCPRCKKDRPGQWFEPPVTICLMCYGTVPENSNVRSLEELRERARNSRAAKIKRRYLHSESRRAELEAMLHVPAAHPAVSAHPMGGALEPEICQRCEQQTVDYETTQVAPDVVEIWCSNCLVETGGRK